MNEPHDPYSPPKAEIRANLEPDVTRPKIIVALVCIYLAAFPFFAWRVSLGGKMQAVVLGFWITVFGLYAIGIAFALLRGERWARMLVIAFAAIWLTRVLGSLFLGALQPGGNWDLRGQIYVIEAFLKTLVAILLLLPSSRKWFASLRAAKLAPAETVS